MEGTGPFHLFEATGVELEYMIVDGETLAVKPICDRLLHSEVGSFEPEIERGAVAWSNELALHVLEFKTNGPVSQLRGVAALFQDEIRYANQKLADWGARLMPGAMHPWMNPEPEFRIWPHTYNPIYQAFHHIFDCRGHGWANLQSTHINLSFGNDEEFGRLHAAVRLLLPILPALAASSPIADGRRTNFLDARLRFYRGNAARVPSLTGLVIPEAVFTKSDYERWILAPIYRDLAPLDPSGVLHHEWVNARGCIARFDRGSIEIRLLDVQECPRADLSIAAAVIAVLKALIREEISSSATQRAWEPGALAAILEQTIRDADEALIRDSRYLATLGYPRAAPCRARDLWIDLIERTLIHEPDFAEWKPALELIADEGCLARRIDARLNSKFSRAELFAVFQELCSCLAAGSLYRRAP